MSSLNYDCVSQPQSLHLDASEQMCFTWKKIKSSGEKNTKLLQGKYGFKVNISASSLCIAYCLLLRNNYCTKGEMKTTKGKRSLRGPTLQWEAHDKKKI